MKLLRTLYHRQPRKCILNGPRQPLPEAIAARLAPAYQHRRIHGNHKNETNKTDLNSSADKLLRPQNTETLLRLHPEPELEPTLYMSVGDKTQGKYLFDKRPPGTHHESGAIKKKPTATKRGRWKAFGLVLALIYMGGQISSLGARMLHEFEIFALPDEDDDD